MLRSGLGALFVLIQTSIGLKFHPLYKTQTHFRSGKIALLLHMYLYKLKHLENIQFGIFLKTPFKRKLHLGTAIYIRDDEFALIIRNILLVSPQ